VLVRLNRGDLIMAIIGHKMETAFNKYINYFLFSFTILRHNIAEINDTGVKPIVSVLVLANKLPSVFKRNNITTNQRIISVILIGMFSFKYCPFIAIMRIIRLLIMIETISKLLICITF
jgi:hypothetical protein